MKQVTYGFSSRETKNSDRPKHQVYVEEERRHASNKYVKQIQMPYFHHVFYSVFYCLMVAEWKINTPS